MALTNAQQVDLLWKKVIFGVTETNVTGKFPSNETIPSPLPVYSSNIWAQTDSTSIPATPPSSNTSTVAVYTVSSGNVIQATEDSTSVLNTTWLATSSYATASSRLTNWIPPTFNPAYVIKVYIGNPNGGPAARILPDTSGEEWVFDYQAGVLYFPNSIPSAKTATIGSGSVTVATNGIYFVGYRYIGTIGVAAAGATSKTTVVANIAARNALSPTAGDVAYVTDASADATVAPGQYAAYLWTGSAWSLIATQESAKSDAASEPASITYLSNASTQLGYISGNNHIASVCVTITTTFNGNCAISVGDAGNNGNIIPSSAIDVTNLGVYTWTPDNVYAANTQTDLFVYFTTDNTATRGAAKVVITFA